MPIIMLVQNDQLRINQSDLRTIMNLQGSDHKIEYSNSNATLYFIAMAENEYKAENLLTELAKK